MKAVLSALAVAATAACSAQPSEQQAIMHAIESAVELPAGARPINEYSRNYARQPDGKIIAAFVVPHSYGGVDEDVGCEIMLENSDARPCNPAEEAEVKTDSQTLAETQGQAGKSRWLDDHLELPTILDGGCDVVTIIYDPRTKRVESAECNGEA